MFVRLDHDSSLHFFSHGSVVCFQVNCLCAPNYQMLRWSFRLGVGHLWPGLSMWVSSGIWQWGLWQQLLFHATTGRNAGCRYSANHCGEAPAIGTVLYAASWKSEHGSWVLVLVHPTASDWTESLWPTAYKDCQRYPSYNSDKLLLYSWVLYLLQM